MIVKYIESVTNNCCMNTINHATIDRDTETGKYFLNLQLADSIISLIVRGNDNINHVKFVELLNELYDTGKLDLTSNIDISVEKAVSFTPDLFAAMGNLGDFGDMDDLDDLDDEGIDYDEFLG